MQPLQVTSHPQHRHSTDTTSMTSRSHAPARWDLDRDRAPPRWGRVRWGGGSLPEWRCIRLGWRSVSCRWRHWLWRRRWAPPSDWDFPHPERWSKNRIDDVRGMFLTKVWKWWRATIVCSRLKCVIAFSICNYTQHKRQPLRWNADTNIRWCLPTKYSN